MTTIAYKAGVLASDSAVCCDGVLKGTTQKIYLSEKGGAVGVCGDLSYMAKFKEWVEGHNCNPTKIPDGEGNASALWVKPDGSTWVVEEGTAVLVNAPYYAIGSGHGIATGAMAVGASAENAVFAATIHDCYSAAPIQIIDMNKKAINADPSATPANNVVPFPKKG